ncbi:sigma-70 family RNA polymerase sigma factor [Glutamicibacter sp.]|uniref:sigma-70 family RNA polymerase sigma factor n=1 Tax=Glutamicibacter sp. TaxID=1931995 RepID=UPI002B472C88|nr:sigma-70 family RNA polymerase sigma factor [Glutamicibacter sp.]HJX79308.1 sigma-70 family RNA polymerase sigma factor [Glutamicibacter sp.]
MHNADTTQSMTGSGDTLESMDRAPSGTGTRAEADTTSSGDWNGVCQRVAQGDHQAFDSLYRELSPVVYGISVRLLRNSALASEVTQEVMLEIWNNAHSFSPGTGSIYAWASTIARRRAIDRIRSEEARTAREDRNFTVDREVTEIDDELMAQVDSERVRSCLETLTDKEKQTVIDTYYGGSTYAQVAERRQMPLATVKSRIRSALQRLKTCLEVA